MIEFVEPSVIARGTTIRLLSAAYHDLKIINPQEVSSWEPRWLEFERIVYDEMKESAHRFCIFTKIANEVIGFISWDPRPFPSAIIGDNCILPDYQGKGYGKSQLRNAINKLKSQGFTMAKVQTEIEGFWDAARAMYESCGFKIQSNPSDTMIEYSLDLSKYKEMF